MSDLADEIQGRGHWRVVLRPDTLQEHRISNIMDLGGIVEKAAVQDTGWPYPAFGLESGYKIGTDWVEFGGHWSRHHEVWRMHQSGQFIHYLGYHYDWSESRGDGRRPPDGKVLGALEVARTYSHIFRFSHNLIKLPLFEGPLAVSIEARDIAERQLFIEVPERGEFYQPHIAAIPSFRFQTVVESEEIERKHDEMAAEGAIELFRRFGWDPKPELVLGMMPPKR